MAVDGRETLRTIVAAALEAVDPEVAVHHHLALGDGNIRVGDAVFPLDDRDRVLVIGAGKAGVPMSRAVEATLRGLVYDGHVIVPHGQASVLERIQIHEAGHPVPDEAGVQAGRAVLASLADADEKTLVICLISGGGSALLVCPVEGVTLEDLQATNQALLACGATIVEINTLRKHLSAVKGGQLARAAVPARMLTLVLSDVVGDPLDAIASGPTVPDTTTYEDCVAIVDRYGLENLLPPMVIRRLLDGASGGLMETPKLGDPIFDRVTNILVANNDSAVRAAARKADELGYKSLVLSTLIEGETRDVAKVHAAIAREIRASGRPCKPPCCLISGGETTVTLATAGEDETRSLYWRLHSTSTVSAGSLSAQLGPMVSMVQLTLLGLSPTAKRVRGQLHPGSTLMPALPKMTQTRFSQHLVISLLPDPRTPTLWTCDSF